MLSSVVDRTYPSAKSSLAAFELRARFFSQLADHPCYDCDEGRRDHRARIERRRSEFRPNRHSPQREILTGRTRASGAAHVINYRAEDVAARVLDITGGLGVDHIAEVDFGGNLAATLRCLRVNGSIMIYASNGDREPKLPVRDWMQKNLTVYSMSLAGVPHPDRKRAQTDIAAWTAMPGRILSVAARFPLYKTAAAHKAVEAGGKVGTVVVEPQR